MTTESFFKVTSDYGWIGPLKWINSNTMPHQDPWCYGVYIRRWGGVTLCHDPSMKFWDEEVEL